MLIDCLIFLWGEWLNENTFHREALRIAYTMGGGEWIYRYWAGDVDVVNAVGESFSFFSAVLNEDVCEKPMAAVQMQKFLVEMVTALR